MIIRALLVLSLLLPLSAAGAQEQQSPSEQQAFLSEALAVLQRQRDEAMNATVNAEARASMLTKQNRSLAERVKVLEAKIKQEPKQ